MYFTVMKCSDSPCRHGACKDTAKGFSCDCPTYYSGQTCDLCMLNLYFVQCTFIGQLSHSGHLLIHVFYQTTVIVDF